MLKIVEEKVKRREHQINPLSPNSVVCQRKFIIHFRPDSATASTAAHYINHAASDIKICYFLIFTIHLK
jgi:hypothetical protein